MTTKQALKASIAHWNRLATGTTVEFETIYSDDCSLCEKFHKHVDQRAVCDGCPVKNKTGYNECRRSPWVAAKNAKLKYGMTSNEFARAAAKFRDWLKRLPENKVTKRKTK